MALPLNKLINSRYILMRHLASGGMADIYEAQDVVINHPVALKFLKEKALQNKEELELFKNEARFTSMFSHPHILKIYNVGEYENQPFVSYELLKGKTLKEVLDNRSHLTVDEVLNYMLQILDAINWIHRAEVIHNDLKPDNIFLLSDGNIKICDFGIACHTFERFHKEIKGSLSYLAGEVLQSKKYSLQSDIYSLGIILYELLTGYLPYEGNTAKEILESQMKLTPPSFKEFGVNNYSDFDYIFKKATDLNLLSRYKNVKEMIDDFNKIKNGEPVYKRSVFKRLFN